MPTPQGTTPRTEIENQLKNNFSELQKQLVNLKNEVALETDNAKKQEKNEKVQRLEEQLTRIKENYVDIITSLNSEKLQSLRELLENIETTIQSFRWEVVDLQNEKFPTPSTYELLKDSETRSKLLYIISANPNEFKNLPWDTPEAKLEYIFSKIRNSIVLFMKNKLWDSKNAEKVINNTIAPAFERSLMELLKNQKHNKNVWMLEWIDSISRDTFETLLSSVGEFASWKKTKSSFNKFSQWMNAIDYLSVHNWVLRAPEKSAVLSNPLKFKEYINNEKFKESSFSPYTLIEWNIFEVSEEETFKFGISLTEKQSVLREIWNIQVVNSPKTTALISKMIDKPEQFLKSTEWLQKTANSLLDWVSSINWVTKMFWIDLLWEISKAPEQRGFLFRIMDFVCKLLWITWGLEWLVKRRRLDRMNLNDEKNDNISAIFKQYKESAWDNIALSITDENSCKTALSDFAVNDLKDDPSTKWDYLRNSIIDNMDVSLISPAIVAQAIEQNELSWTKEQYLKEETVTVKWKQQQKITIIPTWFTLDDKKQLAQYHLRTMKEQLEAYDDNDLKDFYTNITSTEDIALCITASLYADKDDVIEWVKARVFLPENYWSVRSDGTVQEATTTNSWRENLDSAESSDKQIVTEQWVYDKAVEYGITDNRQIAYVLSTIKWESWFKNQKEIWWEDREYWKVDPTTWKAYYGRWFIQITHKGNYEKYTQIIRESWKDFKDNNWNILKWSEIDLVNNPDIILQSNDLAIFIAMDRMKNWWPDRVETKKLSYYINDKKTDYYNARIIINWMSSKPQQYANDALAYQNKLWNWAINNPVESKDLLIWPRLLAHNKNEIWWLGNSIMNWFQWLDAKANFPNMDGVVWKSTVTHPNRFNSQDDVLAYKNTHSNIKSFMFYFWANTRDNNRTLSDIKKWSEWMEVEWIQPVLCTCVWEDKHTWLKELNQNLISLWKEKKWPVIDFAKSYNKWDIALSSDWVHPSSYSTMTNIINWELSQA